jgi:hypothetical protein
MPLPAFDTPLIFEGGQDGRANRYVPHAPALETLLPGALLREDLPLPDNGILSARLVHDEVQPAHQRRAGESAGAARSAPVRAR